MRFFTDACIIVRTLTCFILLMYSNPGHIIGKIHDTYIHMNSFFLFPNKPMLMNIVTVLPLVTYIVLLNNPRPAATISKV